ncbi:MAG TPA: response regulator [Casimicrobiaceae bacterium]|nr:response regulator [Casimicrobiaceae bacterium]
MNTNRPLRGFVILVVDDDADNLELSAQVVRSLGCDALTASSSDEALALLDTGAHVDLVFSDVVMPKTSGLALARAARERGLPVVLGTGYPDAAEEGTDRGVISLIKPYSIQRLEAVFAELLHVDRDAEPG